jgi:hypothetical protein
MVGTGDHGDNVGPVLKGERRRYLFHRLLLFLGDEEEKCDA